MSTVHHLNLGEMIVSSEPISVSTVLGSCVSVCIFNSQTGAGGIVHFAHPKPAGISKSEDGLRYGITAIPALLEELENLTQQPREDFQAKVVGGAGLERDQTARIGRSNVEIARKILNEADIPIVGESVGGESGRKLIFHSGTGRVQVAALRGSQEDTARIKTTPSAKVHGKRKVLIVDDSKPVRTLLDRILKEDSDLEIIGLASSAREAQEFIRKQKPDVITLDVHMPEMTGVEWLETFLPNNPIPVVMITSAELQDGNEVFRALEIGAVDYVQKPRLDELVTLAPLIRDKIRNASFAKVMPKRAKVKPVKSVAHGELDYRRVLAIGASTGGTEAIKDVICALPEKMPPIVIVQHIPPVFSKAFADRLNSLCPFDVREAQDGDELRPGRVLIAPGGKQMKIVAKPTGHIVRITDDAPVNRHKPSVDYLFASVASTLGRNCVGVILTGMGADGAKGLLAIKQKGAKTIAQDEASCVVYGMPRAAFEIGAVDKVASLENIPAEILARLALKA